MNTMNASSSLPSSTEAPQPLAGIAAAEPSYLALAGKILLGIALALIGLLIGAALGGFLSLSAGWVDIGC